jgi:DNA mismatch repair protein MutL
MSGPPDSPVWVDKSTGEVMERPAPSLPSTPAPPHDDAVGPSSGFRLVGRFADVYLLLQCGDDLFIVDQHTAHERVLYEETLKRMAEASVHAQSLLLPAQVELGPEQWTVFEESTEVLQRSGFHIQPFGGRMVTIEAVPSVLGRRSPEQTLLAVLDDLASQRRAGQDLTKAMAQSIACRSAVMSGDRLSDTEAEHLIQQLLRCRDRYVCPHGRPTFIRICKSDLDKQFGRE